MNILKKIKDVAHRISCAYQRARYGYDDDSYKNMSGFLLNTVPLMLARFYAVLQEVQDSEKKLELQQWVLDVLHSFDDYKNFIANEYNMIEQLKREGFTNEYAVVKYEQERDKKKEALGKLYGKHLESLWID